MEGGATVVFQFEWEQQQHVKCGCRYNIEPNKFTNLGDYLCAMVIIVSGGKVWCEQGPVGKGGKARA